MSGSVQSFLRRFWNGDAGLAGGLLSLVAAPLAAGLRVGVAARNRRFDGRESVQVSGIRVVSVGNLVVGGTGKTPLAAWMVRYLASQGESPALVTRGYGRDELLLHARWNPGIPVVADPDRVEATRQAANGGATVAVLDDGFQHRRLHRDVDVVLLAAEDDYPGHLMPWGPYRESRTALGRAHVVVITRRTADSTTAEALALRVSEEHPHLAVAQVHLAPGAWQDLEGTPVPAPTGPVLAATAIAKPTDFADNVRDALGSDVELVSYADHHEFTASEAGALATRAEGRTIVVSEKDAVKLTAFRGVMPGARVLTQDVQWERGKEAVQRLVLGAGNGADEGGMSR